MKKILVPVDFSSQAYNAIALACDFAKKTNAEVFLVNVVEYPSTTHMYAIGEPTFDTVENLNLVQIIDLTKERMKKVVQDPQFCSTRISFDVKVGNPFVSISSDIDDKGIDLIIVGSKGNGDWEEPLIGSNTEKFVRHAKCPVITVKSKVNLEMVKNIVFATNLSNDQGHVVAEIKKLQALLGAKIHIVMINTPNNFYAARKAKKEMEAFVRKYGFENYTINTYNDLIEEDGIVYFAEDIGADMIALGTHGRTGLMHLLSGSIAEDVVNHAKRPVWTYRLKQ
jgi:nucleotide-binding universal stress UspA family protein